MEPSPQPHDYCLHPQSRPALPTLLSSLLFQTQAREDAQSHGVSHLDWIAADSSVPCTPGLLPGAELGTQSDCANHNFLFW